MRTETSEEVGDIQGTMFIRETRTGGSRVGCGSLLLRRRSHPSLAASLNYLKLTEFDVEFPAEGSGSPDENRQVEEVRDSEFLVFDNFNDSNKSADRD